LNGELSLNEKRTGTTDEMNLLARREFFFAWQEGKTVGIAQLFQVFADAARRKRSVWTRNVNESVVP
jgi:hypothetical protein